VTRRVVVTGLGIISPVGNDIASAWDSIVAGRSGIGPVTRFDASSFPTRIAGEVKGFDVAAYMSPKEARHFDTFIHYGIAAGTQAFRDSGIEVSEANADRIGVVIGSGIGGLPLIEDTHAELTSRGVRRVSPFFVPGSIINMISGQLSIMFGLRGPNYAVVSACTTGLHCIGDAARMIAHDDADVIVAGGAESPFRRWAWAVSVPHARCPPATMTRLRQVVHGIATETVSCWARAQGSWCWRSTSTRVGVARVFTPKSLASA
jgi:3-oxoacyl-[acyl-carrier-protein] synthase II